MPAVSWHLKGEEAGGCNCAWGCPCQFNALPTHGRCEGLMTARIAEGYFGTVRLDGVRFAAAFSFPGAMHEGNGTFQLIVDERATTEQREAIIAMSGGKHGGTIFEIFAAVAPNRPAPLVLQSTLRPIGSGGLPRCRCQRWLSTGLNPSGIP